MSAVMGEVSLSYYNYPKARSLPRFHLIYLEYRQATRNCMDTLKNVADVRENVEIMDVRKMSRPHRYIIIVGRDPTIQRCKGIAVQSDCSVQA